MTPRPGLLLHTERIGVAEAWTAQGALAAARRAGRIPDVVWLLEHPPTFTAGRHGRREDLFLADAALAEMGARYVALDRGGQMTWHGPGQSVGYVIADLRPGGRVRRFVAALVGAMGDAAALPGAAAGADTMGLYREGRKLGSVGIRVRDGVTTHGLALNRDPDLGWFGAMTACGAPGVAATSIAAEGGDPDRRRVDGALAEALARRLGLRLEPAALPDLLGPAPGAPEVTLEGLLAEARGRIPRLSPQEARDAAARGGLILDIRDSADRLRGGGVPGALVVPRNVLEWRAALDSGYRDPAIVAAAGPLIVMCKEGYGSSLAVATLRDLGCATAVELAGGFDAWVAVGLPVVPTPTATPPRAAADPSGP